MTDARTLGGLRQLPLRTKAIFGLLGACALVILATTVVVVVQIVRMQWSAVEEAVEKPVVQAPAAPTVATLPPFSLVYELAGMTISLGNRNQTLAAYAEFTLVLDCPTREAHRWMELNRASIRDAVYEATVSFTVEDFNFPEGFTRIKKSIVDLLKTRFGAYGPRDAAIRDWVIR